MTFNRGTVTGSLLGIVASGAVVLAPMAATAQSGPVTDLQASLFSAQSNSSAQGVASYHASKVSSAREFKLNLAGVPIQGASTVRVYVNGAYLTSMPVTSNGGAKIDVRKGVPAMQNGATVKIEGGNGATLCSGKLHLSDVGGSRGIRTGS